MRCARQAAWALGPCLSADHTYALLRIFGIAWLLTQPAVPAPQTRKSDSDLHRSCSHLDGTPCLVCNLYQLPQPQQRLAVCMHTYVKRLTRQPALQYLRYLEKGQIPPPSLSLTAFQRDLMLDGDKYAVHASRTAPDQLRVSLNGSHVDVVARKLSDGGLLFQVDGTLHVVHAEEEASGTRLTIDNLTCLLENEHDPSCLTASSPGKLVRCASDLTGACALHVLVLLVACT